MYKLSKIEKNTRKKLILKLLPRSNTYEKKNNHVQLINVFDK